MKDYYELLGVSRSADKNEIKAAFRKLAMEWHPDVNKSPEAEGRFKELNEAYKVLSNDETRARYDRFGHAGVNGNNGFGGAGGIGGMGGFEEIFEEFFTNLGSAGRGGRGRRGPRQGADRRADVTLTFEESVFGVEREVEFERLETCETCNGNGAEPGSTPVRCTQCNGSGEVRQVQQTFLGAMVQVATCPRCNGRGEMVDKPCVTCKGVGRERKQVTLNVQIPAGVREGLQIQIRGEGDTGEQSAQPGNLFVVVHVDEHEFFKRRDNDIVLEMNLNVAQAALGDKIVVPTVDGPQELAIPEGTQTGKMFRLRGKGVPRLRSDGTSSGRGDQLVYVNVEVPKSLTEEQRRLFEQLGQTLGADITPQRNNGKGFFDRMKDILVGE